MQTLNAYENYYLGEFDIEEDEINGHKLAIYKSTFNTPDSFDCLFKQLEKRKKIRHEHLIRLLSIKQEKSISWCTSVYYLNSTYEYFSSNLQKEMISRKVRSMDFSAQEILRMAYDLIAVLAFLQENQIVNHNVVPTLIFLHEDIAFGIPRVKLFERMNINKNKRTNIISALASNYEIYLDPMYFEWHLKSSEPMPSGDPYR